MNLKTLVQTFTCLTGTALAFAGSAFAVDPGPAMTPRLFHGTCDLRTTFPNVADNTIPFALSSEIKLQEVSSANSVQIKRDGRFPYTIYIENYGTLVGFTVAPKSPEDQTRDPQPLYVQSFVRPDALGQGQPYMLTRFDKNTTIICQGTVD